MHTGLWCLVLQQELNIGPASHHHSQTSQLSIAGPASTISSGMSDAEDATTSDTESLPATTSDTESPSATSDTESLSSQLKQVGCKYRNVRTAVQKENFVKRVTPSELNTFRAAIHNIYYGNIELSSDETKKLKKFKTDILSYLRAHTSRKTRKEILVRGALLQHLGRIMSQI